MSDIGPIPAKDQTNYLLGRLEGSVNSLSSQVATAAEARAQADIRHEAEHANPAPSSTISAAVEESS